MAKRVYRQDSSYSSHRETLLLSPIFIYVQWGWSGKPSKVKNLPYPGGEDTWLWRRCLRHFDQNRPFGSQMSTDLSISMYKTRLSLKCSAWKGFMNFASKKISKETIGPKKILCQKRIFKKKIWFRKILF